MGSANHANRMIAMKRERNELMLAEQITRQTLLDLGFREPEKHPRWEMIVEHAQDKISLHVDSMSRVAELDARRRLRERRQKREGIFVDLGWVLLLILTAIMAFSTGP